VRLGKLHHLLIGAVIALAVIVPLGTFAFVKSGIFNVGASSPHTRFTEWITHETMIHSVKSHARGIVAPTSAAAGQVHRGFCAYETHCVACHGAPAVARERWVSGMEPAPPYLLDASRRWRPRELFWIVKNGIKMTGMPSWRDSMSDRDIWDVVAFLEAMGRMNSQDYVRWRASNICLPSLQGRGKGVGGGRAGSMPARKLLQPHRTASVAPHP
jgi:mono/diheme cytochrome c family protein